LQVAKALPSNRSGADAGPVCFEVPSAYEIVAGGKKLVGSAQSRRQGWVLQHGTLPLVGDVTRLVEVVAVAGEAERPALRAHLAERAVTVAELLGREVGFQEAAEALVAGFEEALGIRFVSAPLTPAELATAERLRREVYASDGWNGKF
jgi:lipoate-protein ligase A